MINYDEIISIPPYSMKKDEREKLFLGWMKELTKHHDFLCPEYHKIMLANSVDVEEIEKVEDIPFLPVRLFKEYDLKSIGQEDVVKTMTSSGTTGQQVSKIYLDREASAYQTKTLSKIVSSYLGNTRLPMIVMDTSAIVKNRNVFSARAAGIRGFSIFGRDIIYALDEDMNLNIDEINQFLEKHKGENIFLFGFTFMIWQHFYQLMKKNNYQIDLSNGILIHGGGWKKLVDSSVSPEEFKKALYEVCSIKKVYDYYGMVEQTGTIYVECECGHLHTSLFSDVIIRRAKDFQPADIGETGLIQTMSVLPKSYPGHSLLTEDEGIMLGEDDCPCGRNGKYFKVIGRIKNAEIRGCSDTYASKFA